MHKSAFHTSYGDAVLFKDWVLSGPRETYISCIVIAALGITFQGIKFARQQYGRRCNNLQCKRYIFNKSHLLQTLMYIVQFVWGYFIMLAVMSYNAWIMIAAMIGFGVGYFLFGWGEYEDHNSRLSSIHQPRHTCRTGAMSQQLLSPSATSALSDPDAPDCSMSNKISCPCNEDTRL